MKHTTHTGTGDGGVRSISRWSDSGAGSYGGVLHRVGDFSLRTNDVRVSINQMVPRFPSVIEHMCDSVVERDNRTVTNVWQGTWSANKYEKCKRCHVDIPDELLTLWRLHNWDELVAWLGAHNDK